MRFVRSVTAARSSAAFGLSMMLVACAADAGSELDTSMDDGASTTAAQWEDPEPQPPRCDALPRSTNCGAPLAPGDERVCRVGNRSFTIRAGKTYDPCKKAAVVIDVPAVGESPNVQLGRETFCLGNVCWSGLGSGWAAESDTPGGGFIVVVPHGARPGDADFLQQLVKEVGRVADVDAKRVYVSGLGAGGDAAHEAGCRHSKTFRGVSPNSGGVNCSGVERGIPVISFAARGDVAFNRNYAAMESMARANGCKSGPSDWRTFGASTRDPICRSQKDDPRASLVPCASIGSPKLEPTTCKIWRECRDGAEVVFCEVAPNTAHGRMNAAVDAHIVYQNNTNLNTPSVAWRFFQQFK